MFIFLSTYKTIEYAHHEITDEDDVPIETQEYSEDGGSLTIDVSGLGSLPNGSNLIKQKWPLPIPPTLHSAHVQPNPHAFMHARTQQEFVMHNNTNPTQIDH